MRQVPPSLALLALLAAGCGEPVVRGADLERSIAEVRESLEPRQRADFDEAIALLRLAGTGRVPGTEKVAIDGMTDPFFLEIIVNPDLLPSERPFVIAHEWAHIAGFADEAEANFIAWLTCLRASPAAQYSAWLSAYQHVSSGLPPEDRRALAGALSPAVRADLIAERERFNRSSPAVRTAARGAYDTYLRANRIEDGIASYNAVVRLMLGTSLDADWNPRLR